MNAALYLVNNEYIPGFKYGIQYRHILCQPLRAVRLHAKRHFHLIAVAVSVYGYKCFDICCVVFNDHISKTISACFQCNRIARQSFGCFYSRCKRCIAGQILFIYRFFTYFKPRYACHQVWYDRVDKSLEFTKSIKNMRQISSLHFRHNHLKPVNPLICLSYKRQLLRIVFAEK